MAWPPPVLGITHTNETPLLDTHVADHNALALAINDIHPHIDSTLSVRKQSTTTVGSAPHATWTRLTCNTGEFSHGQGIQGDSNGVITDLAGLCLIIGQVYWEQVSASSGRRLVGFSTDPAATPTSDYTASRKGTTAGFIQTITVPYHVTVAPTQFHLWGYQDSGSTMSIKWRRTTVVRLTHAF